jgi:hypothetical protein
MITMRRIVTLMLALSATAVPALAETMHVEAVMAPKQQMQLDFKDGSKHFVLLVRREGKAEGSGPLAGASVVEFGMHDIVPGVGGEPRGYLELTAANGDIAYIRWQIGAVFVPGPEGKPVLLDNGYWQIAGGTGGFAKLAGAGTLHLKPTSPTDRRFILDGDVVRGP